MPVTSVDLPAGLLDAAMQALGASTKRETIVSALEEVVRRRRQVEALDALAGMDHLAEMLDPEVRARARR